MMAMMMVMIVMMMMMVMVTVMVMPTLSRSCWHRVCTSGKATM